MKGGCKMAESVFREEDVKAAVDAIKDWMQKNGQAGVELAALWKKHYMTAGHKTLAREVVKAAK
jgi:hypothetical protein